MEQATRRARLLCTRRKEWIGPKGFSGKAGQLRYEKAGNKVVAFGDTNGDSKADLALGFFGLNKVGKDDFLL